MKKIICFLIFTLLIISCGEECYNAPQPIVFEFVNANNENLIASGSLGTFYIKDENQTNVPLTTTDDHKVILENVGVYNGVKNYKFYSSVRNFDFSIESSEYKGGCDGYQINKLTFTGIAIDVTDENGYYKITFQ